MSEDRLRRLKELKKEKFLKFIILYKMLAGLSQFMLALWVLSFIDDDIGEWANDLALKLGLDTEASHIMYLVDKAGEVSDTAVVGVAAMLFMFTMIAFIEAWGLHLRRRWAEWLTVGVTASFIPLELYDAITRMSKGMVIILIINCSIVYYLARHKELFSNKPHIVNDDF